ncbi:hypothetical protein SISNIDRAFT_489695 [Sistotremastrum niveocremeum HHB9708]|uniref:DUF6535 domain-containing protein n=1 Tax=Sistotremastrum niveocremeum HHB9708 TaxID=1314777 RepID=A0A164PLK6_9AGAM|nr:hypothetical protein SISNIDRAFT_489695 [Sistotremastrum niveocremeum HHB9708]
MSEPSLAPNTTPETAAKANIDPIVAEFTSSDRFGALLDAIKDLNVVMKGVKSTLVDHGTKFDVLIKDALKNDQPYDEKALDDESTSLAVYEIVMAKTKERTEEWNGTIDVTLIFIALFSAVLTAFLVPATQNLLPNWNTNNTNHSTSTTNPRVPSRSAEAICALYYLSLIIAILIGVLCALGRQWVRKLTIKPTVQSWRARTMWHVERMQLAEIWLKLLMEILYRLLVLSIALFMSGLLYQLRILADSFGGRATILLRAWELGIVLTSCIAFTMGGTTYHAVRYEASVFDGMVSKVIIALCREHQPPGQDQLGLRQGGGELEDTIKVVRIAKYLRGRVGACELSPYGEDMEVEDGMAEAFRRMGAGEARQPDHSSPAMDKAPLNPSRIEPGLLERAAASFSFSHWVQHGGGTVDDLWTVRTRLNATDTSFRVRETINAQIPRFRAWLAGRHKEIEDNRKERYAHEERLRERGGFELHLEALEDEAKKEDEEEHRAIELTQFLLNQRTDRISGKFTPTRDNCAGILELIGLPFDVFVAKCLCVHDRDDHSGNHHDIFHASVNYCEALRSRQSEGVTQILSHLDTFSAVRSFILDSQYLPWYDRVLDLIIDDRGIDVLFHLNQFVSQPRDWSTVDPAGLSSVFLLAAGSPAQLHNLPSETDLSPIIGHLARRPLSHNWRQASSVLITYLEARDFSTLSDLAGVHTFLQRCVDPAFLPDKDEGYQTSGETRDIAFALLYQHRAQSIPLPPSPPPSPLHVNVSLRSQYPAVIFPLQPICDSPHYTTTSCPLQTPTTSTDTRLYSYPPRLPTADSLPFFVDRNVAERNMTQDTRTEPKDPSLHSLTSSFGCPVRLAYNWQEFKLESGSDDTATDLIRRRLFGPGASVPPSKGLTSFSPSPSHTSALSTSSSISASASANANALFASVALSPSLGPTSSDPLTHLHILYPYDLNVPLRSKSGF